MYIYYTEKSFFENRNLVTTNGEIPWESKAEV